MSILQIILLVLWYAIGVTIAVHEWTLKFDLSWADLLFVCVPLGLFGPILLSFYVFILFENVNFSFDFLDNILIHKQDKNEG